MRFVKWWIGEMKSALEERATVTFLWWLVMSSMSALTGAMIYKLYFCLLAGH